MQPSAGRHVNRAPKTHMYMCGGLTSYASVRCEHMRLGITCAQQTYLQPQPYAKSGGSELGPDLSAEMDSFTECIYSTEYVRYSAGTSQSRMDRHQGDICGADVGGPWGIVGPGMCEIGV